MFCDDFFYNDMAFCFVCGDSYGHFCKALRQWEILSSGVLRKNLPGLMLVVTSDICAADLAKTDKDSKCFYQHFDVGVSLCPFKTQKAFDFSGTLNA